MNIVYFTGNVGQDPEQRDINGNSVCNFSVAVKQGFGRDAPTAWYRCEVWGKRGDTIAQHVTKGSKVAACGELIIGEYNGKPQYRVRIHDIDPFCGGKPEGGQRQSGGQGGTGFNDSHSFNDLDDDVPFATCDPALEYRVR